VAGVVVSEGGIGAQAPILTDAYGPNRVMQVNKQVEITSSPDVSIVVVDAETASTKHLN
jgi:hypothetical protein